MNIEILNMAKRPSSDRAIDVALPVLAIECEAIPPLENYLDAYEETALKLISIGLSTRGIAGTLKVSESLIEEILDSLAQKKYAVKETGKPWNLTEDGEKYLNGSVEERESDNCQFGYMFVNAIKKEVLPFFYHGDLDKAPLFRGSTLPIKLTLNGNEDKTFESYLPKRSRMKEAYKRFCKNSNMSKQYGEGEITLEEAVDLFEGLGSFDEEDDTESRKEDVSNVQDTRTNNIFIRALDNPPKHVYLTMRVFLDPQYPGGYKVESPFDFDGIDNSYYLRQVQWLAASGTTFAGDEKLEDFLMREIRHLAPNFTNSDKDFDVFVLEKIPLLKINRDRFDRIYEDMFRIYPLMQRQSSLLEKENIVNNISRNVVESLFNEFYKGIANDTLLDVSKIAVSDLNYYDCKNFIKHIFQNTELDPYKVSWSRDYTLLAIGRLAKTKGNSIVEKFINVIVLNYYLGTNETKKFLTNKSVQKMYELADQLNQIRLKVSHDTDKRFEPKDYDFYISNVFTLINSLLEAYREAWHG